MCALSIFTSANPPESISQFADWTLNWYVPALSCVIAIRTSDDIRGLLKFVAILSLFVTAVGVADFIDERNYAVLFMPKVLVDNLMVANPAFAAIVDANPFRNGIYRASSIFAVPLSYGEFSVMVAPIGGYFLMHGENYRERLLGALVVFCSVASLAVSGARGGNVALIVSGAAFLALWLVRFSQTHPRSIVGPLLAATSLLATSSFIALVAVWTKLRVVVLGGGETASSNTARLDQAIMAWPHILANPLSGHGVGNAGDVVGYVGPGGVGSIDSSLLSALLETGVPGFLFYFGLLIFATWTTGRLYLQGRDRESYVGIAFSCSFLAYLTYRIVLSQRENQSLLFILIATACVALRLAADRTAQKSAKTAEPEFSAQPKASVNPWLRPGPAASAINHSNG